MQLQNSSRSYYKIPNQQTKSLLFKLTNYVIQPICNAGLSKYTKFQKCVLCFYVFVPDELKHMLARAFCQRQKLVSFR